MEIVGAAQNARAGYALASGDFNGDGLTDLVISSDGVTPLGGTRKGEFEIVWGNQIQTGGTIDLAVDGGISRIFGRSNDFPLLCVLGSGDFNNDGRDDIIIGEPLSGPFSDGLAYVILGDSDFPDTLDLQTSPSNVVTIHGGPWSGWLGGGVCSCDLNGDQYDEIVISAPAMTYGEVYVIQGADSFQSSYNMGQAQSSVTRIIDNYELQGTGRSLACGDIDQDGYGDLVIGSSGEGPDTWDGIVTLLYGDSVLPDTISLANSAFRLKRLFGEYAHGFLGRSVTVGDVDKDGKEDLILAAPVADPLGCLDCGEVYIFYSANDLPESTLVNTTQHPATRIIGSRRSSKYGTQVLCDDFSGDGYDDIVLSCTWINNVQSTKDTVAVWYGGFNHPDSIFVGADTTLSRIIAANHGDYLGNTAMTSADYNMDGNQDIALGAHSYDEGLLSNAGKVYVLYGSSTPTAIRGQRLPLFVVKQNYPNPFSSHTVIEYELPSSSRATLTIYNVQGRRVSQIQMPVQSKGSYAYLWNGVDDKGRRLASGIYFYRLQASGLSQTKKMIVLR